MKKVMTMLNYENIITALEEEKAACQYAYGGMVPAFYAQALRAAILDIKECQNCAGEAERMADEINRK